MLPGFSLTTFSIFPRHESVKLSERSVTTPPPTILRYPTSFSGSQCKIPWPCDTSIQASIRWINFCVFFSLLQDPELCISLGLSLQYLRVCVVCWLAAMCHHLYATVASVPCRDDPPTYLKYSVFAWGAPLITLGGAIYIQTKESSDLWNIKDLTPFNCW